MVRELSSSRREVLLWAGALLLGADLLPVGTARAVGDDAAFAAGSLEKLVGLLGHEPASGPDVSIMVPDFVENGAVVPVEVTTRLTGEQDIYIVSESNPFPLVARFTIPEGTDPYVSVRIKVAQSCKVYAIVKAGDHLYWASKATTVTVGGCGG